MAESYTGIASRVTPNFIEEVMVSFAKRLNVKGWLLRSGHTEGDDAFEWGAGGEGSPGVEIYIPWANFNGSEFGTLPSQEARQLAAKAVPWWHNMNEVERDLAARAAHEMLGIDLNSPSRFLICWTPDGAMSVDDLSAETGGCMWAITIASYLDIPIFNLAVKEHAKHICDFAKIEFPKFIPGQ